MKKQEVCERFSEDLLLLAYDELSEPRKKELEKHLDECPYCQTELSRLRLLKKEVKNSVKVDELSEHFWEKNLESIRERVSTEKSHKAWYPKLAASLAAACIVAIALVVGTSMKKTSLKDRKPVVNSSMSNVSRAETDDSQIVARMEVLENLDVLENILNIVEKDKVDQG